MSCNCKACKAAVSPFAYLADLLSYAEEKLTHIKEDLTEEVSTPVVLGDIFCQPFDCLTTECDEIENTLCQYRVAIEVLNCYLAKLTLNQCTSDSLSKKKKEYLKEAYYALLEEFGTSFSELRKAANKSDSEKEKLTDKLAIPLTYLSSETLNQLFLDPKATSGSKQITSALLESLFGLRDINYSAKADCSSNGSLSPLSEPLITTWRIDYLKTLWIEADAKLNDYVEGNTPLIDPDMLIPGDFVGPKDFSGSNHNAAYAVWFKRRRWIDDIINNVFLDAAYLTLKANTLGNKTVTLDSIINLNLKPFDKFKISSSDSSTDNMFTIETVNENGGNTEIVTVEGMPLLTNPTIEIEQTIAITSIDATNKILTIGSDLTSYLSPGDLFIIEQSDDKNGVYTIDSITSTTITIAEPALPNNTVSNETIRYRRAFSGSSVSIDRTGMAFYAKNDSLNEMPSTSPTFPVTVSGTEYLDGDYEISGVAASGVSGYLKLDLDTNYFFKKEDNGGHLSFVKSKESSSGSTLEVTDSSFGNHAITIDDQNLNTLLQDSDFSYPMNFNIEGSTGNDGYYEITSSNNVSIIDNETYIELSDSFQVLQDDTADGFAVFEFPISMVLDHTADWDLEVNAFDLTDFINASDIIEIDIDSSGDIASFVVNTGSTWDTTKTTINISDHPRAEDVNTTNSKLRLKFAIHQVDLEGRHVIVNDDLSGELYQEQELVIGGETYTVLDIVYGTSTTVYVNEVIKEDLSNAAVSFTKTVSLSSQKPDIDALYTFMQDDTTGVSYDATPYQPWTVVDTTAIIDTINDFEAAYNDFNNGTVDVSALESEVKNELNMSLEAFIRMVELQLKIKGKLEVDEPFTVAEQHEFYNILIQSIKNTLKSTWLTEETSASINFDYNSFRPVALKDPEEGDVFLNYTKGTPLCDPQLIKVGQIPNADDADGAVTLWNTRHGLLEFVHDFFKSTLLNKGIQQALEQVFFYVFEGKDIKKAITNTQSKLVSIDPEDINEAQTFITEQLLLTQDDFAAIINYIGKYNSSQQTPTNEDLNRIATILTGVYKKKYFYPVWLSEERNTTGYIENASGNYDYKDYWLVIKPKLPKWRASLSERNTWQSALNTNNRRPIVDPDLVLLTDFINQSSNSAKTLYDTRRSLLATQLSTIKSTSGSNSQQKVNNIIYSYLGLSDIAEFELLADLEAAGVKITRYLQQLHIGYPEYRRLTELKAITDDDANAQLQGHEWEEIYFIVLQAWKVREKYASWNKEEADNSISLSPLYFRYQSYYATIENGMAEIIPLWRANYKERRGWEKTLQSRIDQEATTREAIRTAISNAEEKVLPIMRDALVMAAGDDTMSLAENARTLSDLLLVDFSTTCCQKTNRLSIAIDVMQKLLWSMNEGLNTYATDQFRLDDDQFEEKWEWMGSYATWRSAMFVYLYPENLLAPEYKRVQTPVFNEIVGQVVNSSRFSPEDACTLGHTYSDYAEDVRNMNVRATCNTRASFYPNSSTSQDCSQVPIGKRPFFFAFGIGPKTNKVYWTSQKIIYKEHLNNRVRSTHTFWESIPGLGTTVKKILGAVPFEDSSGDRNIYLFILIQKDKAEEEFGFIKYNLESRVWDTEYVALEVPDDTVSSSITIKQTNIENLPPLAILKVQSGGFYRKSMNEYGTDWDDTEWELFVSNAQGKGAIIESAVALSPFGKKDYILFASYPNYNGSGRNALYYRVFGTNDTTRFEEGYSETDANRVNNKSYVGAFNFLKDRKIEFYARTIPGNDFQHYAINIGNANKDKKIETWGEFDNWLKAAANVSLSDITLSTSSVNDFRKVFDDHSSYSSIKDSFFDLDINFLNILEWFEGVKSNYKNDIGAIPIVIELRTQILYLMRYLTTDLPEEDSPRGADWNSAFKDFKHFSNVRDNANGGSIYQLSKIWIVHNTAIGVNTSNSTFIYASQQPNLKVSRRISAGTAGEILGLHSASYNEEIQNASKMWPNSGGWASDYQGKRRKYYAFTTASNHSFRMSFINEFQSFKNGASNVSKSKSFFKLTLNPVTRALTPINLSIDELTTIKSNISSDYSSNIHHFDKEYLREACYFLPLFFAINLSRKGYYEEALDWFKTMYDYRQQDASSRVIYEGLKLDAGDGEPDNDFERDMENWLLDPLNPHSIAKLRENSYLKFTIFSLAQCLIKYADAEYTLDNVESLSRATELYELAIDLLNDEALNSHCKEPEFTASPVELTAFGQLGVQYPHVGSQALCNLFAGALASESSNWGPNDEMAVNQLAIDANNLNLSASDKEDLYGDMVNALTTNAGYSEYDFYANYNSAVDVYENAKALEQGAQTMSGYLANKKDLQVKAMVAANSAISQETLWTMADKLNQDYTDAAVEVMSIDEAELENPANSYPEFAWNEEERQAAG